MGIHRLGPWKVGQGMPMERDFPHESDTLACEDFTTNVLIHICAKLCSFRPHHLCEGLHGFHRPRGVLGCPYG